MVNTLSHIGKTTLMCQHKTQIFNVTQTFQIFETVKRLNIIIFFRSFHSDKRCGNIITVHFIFSAITAVTAIF